MLDDPGKRIFSISANEKPIASNLDAAADYKRYVGAIRRIHVTTDDGQGVVIRFAAGTAVPFVNAFVVRRTSE